MAAATGTRRIFFSTPQTSSNPPLLFVGVKEIACPFRELVKIGKIWKSKAIIDPLVAQKAVLHIRTPLCAGSLCCHECLPMGLDQEGF